MKAIAKAVILALAPWIEACSCGPIEGAPCPAAPSILLSWHGTAEIPWGDVDRACGVVYDGLARHYPSLYREPFEIAVYGANDWMPAGGSNGFVRLPDGRLALLMGGTDRVCSEFLGLECGWRVSVRQTRVDYVVPDPSQPEVPRFYGALATVDHSALFWEISHNYGPLRLGRDDVDDPTNVADNAFEAELNLLYRITP